MGSEPKMPELPEPVDARMRVAWGPPPDYYTAEQMHSYAQAYAAGIRAAVLGEVVTKLVQSGQPLAAATITTLEQQP